MHPNGLSCRTQDPGWKNCPIGDSEGGAQGTNQLGRGGPGALANHNARARHCPIRARGGLLSRVEVALSPRAPETHLFRTASGVLSASLSPAGAVGRTPEGPGAALRDGACALSGSRPGGSERTCGTRLEAAAARVCAPFRRPPPRPDLSLRLAAVGSRRPVPSPRRGPDYRLLGGGSGRRASGKTIRSLGRLLAAE